MSHKAKRRLKPEERREQILDTAMKLFAQKGFDRTTIDDIADACGIAPGLVYHYFDSKTAILQAILERHSFLPVLAKMLREPPAETLEGALTAIAYAFWQMLEEKREFALMLHGEMHRNSEVARLVSKMVRTGVQLLSDYLTKQKEAGKLRADTDNEIFTRTLFGALFESFFAHHRLAPSVRRIAPERLVEGIVRLLLYGACASKPSESGGTEA